MDYSMNTATCNNKKQNSKNYDNMWICKIYRKYAGINKIQHTTSLHRIYINRFYILYEI